MAKRSKRKGHGTGVKDYQSTSELSALPPRRSLAPGKNGPTVQVVANPPTPMIIKSDDRTPEEQELQATWDKRVAEILAERKSRLDNRKTTLRERNKQLAVDRSSTLSSGERSGTASVEAPPKPTEEPEETPVVRNGRPRVSTVQGGSDQVQAIRPRQAAAPVARSTEQRSSGSTNQVTYLNGISDRADTPTVEALKGAARADAHVLREEANTRRKDAKFEAVRADRMRGRQGIRDRIAEDDDTRDFYEKRRRDLDKKRAERDDRRYEERVVTDADDWKNLGRLRGDERDGAAWKDGEYNETMKGLYDRAKALRSAKGRAGLSDPELREMNAFFKTVGDIKKDAEGNWGGNLTRAQAEALDRQISKYEGVAGERQGRAAARTKALEAQNIAGYRQKYGLEDRSVFSDSEVKTFHENRVKAGIKDVLTRMSRDNDPRNSLAYADDWAALGKAGADFDKAFKDAMSNEDTKNWYMNQVAGKTPDEAGQIRQQVILDQLYGEYGLRQPTNQKPATVDAQDASAPEQGQEQPQDVSAGLASLVPRKKDTFAVVGGGSVIKPRRR